MRIERDNLSPFSITKFKAVKDGSLFGVAAEAFEFVGVKSEKNWQARYDGPETEDFSPTAVYRAFDRNGLLLYVGSSSQFWKRIYRHWYDVSAWSNDASFMYVETYPNKSVAKAVECGAILIEDPVHNRHRFPEHFGRRSMRGYVKQGQVLKSFNPFWLGVGSDLRDLSPIDKPQADSPAELGT